MFNDWRVSSRRDRKSGADRSAFAAQDLHTFKLPGRSGQGDDTLAIRLADCDGQKSRARVLLNRAYSKRGYGADHQLPTAPSCVTFVATSADDLLGTLTLTIDSSSALAADRTFGDEMEKFRARRGARLCELTKFAFETATPARPRLAALFHIIFIYESVHYGCTDLFIEVNPRHRCFYESMLGFTSMGVPRTNESVNAPSQLMWLNLAKMRGLIDQHARTPAKASRSLYPNFFSPDEEQQIRLRMGASEGRPIFFPSSADQHGELAAERPWAASPPGHSRTWAAA